MLQLAGRLVPRQVEGVSDFLLSPAKGNEPLLILERLTDLRAQIPDALLGVRDALRHISGYFVEVLNHILNGADCA